MTNYVLFHARKVSPNGLHTYCIDGLFAAYAALQAMPDAILIPAIYGHPPEPRWGPGDCVYLLDLTYAAQVIESWADLGATIQVIDHHKTAMNDLAGLSERILKEFDMTRSGAVMAWEYFLLDKPLPTAFRLVQDRDLWVKKYLACDEFNYGINELVQGKPLDEALSVVATTLDRTALSEVIRLGQLVQDEVHEAIEQALAQRAKRLILGDEVVFAVATTPRQKQAYSDIAHALLEEEPQCKYACVQSGEGWALRSSDDHQDVSVVAKAIGGGGHRNASGCRADMPYWAARLLQAITKGWNK